MEQDKEMLNKLKEIYKHYKEDASSLPILLYRCIRLLDFKISEEELKKSQEQKE